MSTRHIRLHRNTQTTVHEGLDCTAHLCKLLLHSLRQRGHNQRLQQRIHQRAQVVGHGACTTAAKHTRVENRECRGRRQPTVRDNRRSEHNTRSTTTSTATPQHCSHTVSAVQKGNKCAPIVLSDAPSIATFRSSSSSLRDGDTNTATNTKISPTRARQSSPCEPKTPAAAKNPGGMRREPQTAAIRTENRDPRKREECLRTGSATRSKRHSPTWRLRCCWRLHCEEAAACWRQPPTPSPAPLCCEYDGQRRGQNEHESAGMKAPCEMPHTRAGPARVGAANSSGAGTGGHSQRQAANISGTEAPAQDRRVSEAKDRQTRTCCSSVRPLRASPAAAPQNRRTCTESRRKTA
jgi:hypothetical protein